MSRKRKAREFWVTKNYGLYQKEYPWNAFDKEENAFSGYHGIPEEVIHVVEVLPKKARKK